ncbi:MAG: mechanosensitive ion channel family protein [Leptolyngbyaceae cyanobacterium]
MVILTVSSPALAQLEATPDGADATAAPQETVISNEVDGFPVFLDGILLFQVREGIAGITSAQERANIIEQRIAAIANNADITPEDIRADINEQQSVVLAGETVILTISETDAAAYDDPHPQLAEVAVERIQQGLITYREKRSLRRLITSIVVTVVSTIVLILFLRGLFLLASKLLIQIQHRRETGTLEVRFQSVRLLNSGASSYLLSGLVRLLRVALVLLALYLYVPFVLSQFPATEVLGDSVLQDVAFRLNSLAQAFVAYLPSLVMVGVIAVIAYYTVQLSRQIIEELGRPGAYPWFYEEWIEPTIRLVTLMIIAIAFVMAGPYLPGFGSPAFQGISIFFGALLTLGSSSAVANALSGIILIYTRAFQLGDYICLDDTVGTVADKSLFVTRLLTPKQETVTIPNASVLNNNVINYSAICREANGHLLLYTTVTLGYDVPWRKVHEVLITAAKTTPHIEAEPTPFVLQTALNDFNVSYQLNAYTSDPAMMPRIYSELHQNIQDKCNEADIEILSPHFSALRDGNHSTLPADYLPEGYTSPAFWVQSPPQNPNKSVE